MSIALKEVDRLRNIYRRTKHAVDKAAWRVKVDEYVQKIETAKMNILRN